jgi:hypothetical protein
MKSPFLFLPLAILLISACSGTFDVGMEHLPTSIPPTAQVVTATSAPISTAAPAASLPLPSAAPLPSTTPLPSSTISPAPTQTSGSTSTLAAFDPASIVYIDDRSTASQVIVSLFNAINRREYARAYDYWINPATAVGDFTAYASGYQDTAWVNLAFGQITASHAAGQIYYTVPVILKTTARNNTQANYAACYLVHESQPANFGAPPFNAMGIDRGSAEPADLHASDASTLATACSAYPTGPSPVPVSGGSLNIDKNNFLDSRSGPIETVSSLLNAINLKQYVRAYSYFQSPADFPGPYAPYAAGYSGTESITATFGRVQSDAAAGSLYYKVPLAMQVLTTSATTQTFVGCYTLRLGQPANQTVPPFQPLGIISGTFNQVANDSALSSLLPKACN